MAKPSGDRDSGDWMEEVCFIFASLLSCLGEQAASLIGRGVPGYPLDESWKDLSDALAGPSASGDLVIPPNIDPEGQYNVPLVGQVQALQDPMDNIDADNAAAAEADLDMLLAVAEVVGLPRQIERDEANIMRPQELSFVAESGVAPSSLLDDVAAGAPQHQPPQTPVPETVTADAPSPDVVGILAAHAETQVEGEVAIEAIPPGMLELISDVARLPQFATASMAPAGDLESNLEERVPVDHPEAGDSSKTNVQDDVENLEIKESHAKGTK